MKQLIIVFSLIVITGSFEFVEAQRRVPGFPAGTVIDLSYPFDSSTVYWPTAEAFHLEKDFEGTTEKGFYYSAYKYSAAEHGGTHLDAPVHFAKGRNTVDEIPLEQLMGPAVVVDVQRQCAGNPDYQITERDLRNWERQHGMIPPGTILLLRTGFGKFYPDRKKYLGTDQAWRRRSSATSLSRTPS